MRALEQTPDSTCMLNPSPLVPGISGTGAVGRRSRLLPRRLRIAGWRYRLARAAALPGLLRATRAWKILPLGKFAAVPPVGDAAPRQSSLPALTPAQGARRARVGLLTGCIQDEM